MTKARRLGNPPLLGLALVVASAVAALLYFDAQAPLAYNDDWIYAWVTRQLVTTHHLRAFPEQSSFSLVQVVFAAVATLGHTDQRLLRVTAVPFVLLGAGSLVVLARGQGADPFWALFAGAALLCSPLFMGVATSFMGDAFYMGLMLAAAVAAVHWLRTGGGVATTAVLCLAAGLQRQHALGLPLAIAAGLLVARRERRVAPGEWAAAAAILAGLLALQPLSAAAGLATAMQAARLHRILSVQPIDLMSPPAFLSVLMGFTLLPFLPGLLGAHRRPGRSGWIVMGASVALGGLGLAVEAILALHGWRTFPGNTVTNFGLNPALLEGQKVGLFPLPLFFGLEAASALVAAYVLFACRHQWSVKRLGGGGVLLLALAGTQLVPMVQTGFLDRYYLPVLAPLLAVAAGLVGQASPGRRWAGVALLAGGLGIYIAGQQDYGAWMQAREDAARMAYRQVNPAEVDAGYEAYAVHVVLPRFERDGSLPRKVADDRCQPSLMGPPRARMELRLSTISDPRPGVSYSSLAPGRVVLTPPGPPVVKSVCLGP